MLRDFLNTVPDLTVVTPVLNGAAHIRACIESTTALSRDGLVVEHIVVDGGSTDATLDLLVGVETVRVLHRPSLGAHEACNIGVSAARGRAIAFLMADDVWSPEAQDAFVEALAAPGWDMALFAADLIGGANVRRLPAPRRLWDVLRRYPGLNSALLTADLARCLTFNALYPAVHDRLLMLDALAACKRVRYSDVSVVRLVAHAGSLTMSPARDVVGLKRELNTLGAALVVASRRKPANDVITFWQAHTALSLWLDPVLASLRGERRIDGRAPARAKFPAVTQWHAAGAGFAAILMGRDAFVSARHEGENQWCRDVGLAGPL